jgi:aminoacylase
LFFAKPDEEIGGADGMGQLLASAELGSLQPIGFALDEGLANPRNAFTVFYGERTPWWLLVRAKGPTVRRGPVAAASRPHPPPRCCRRRSYTVAVSLSTTFCLPNYPYGQGHGSRFIQGTAVEKLMEVVTKALAFRHEQEAKLGWDCAGGCNHAQVLRAEAAP